MIIPSFLYQILLFQNEDKTWTQEIKPTANGYALAKTSDNKKVIIRFIPNFKGRMKKGQVYEWFINKSESLVKSDEIKEVQTSLSFSEDYINKCKSIEQKENRKLSKSEKKDILEQMAKVIVYNRNVIKGGVVVSSAISRSSKYKTFKYKNKELPFFIARALFYEYGKPSTTGLYIIANKYNDIPVRINKINNQDFYSISTNIFTKFKSKILLLGMLYRTALKYKDKNKAIFGYFNYRGNNQEIKAIVNGLNKLSKTKDTKNVDRYMKGIKEYLYPLLLKNPKDSIDLHITLPLLLKTEEVMSLITDDKSNIVKNFKTLDILNKKEGTNNNVGENCINLLKQKKYLPQTIFAVYSIASINSLELQDKKSLFEDVEHWGFMLNQVKSHKAFLSNQDFKALYLQAKIEK